MQVKTITVKLMRAGQATANEGKTKKKYQRSTTKIKQELTKNKTTRKNNQVKTEGCFRDHDAIFFVFFKLYVTPKTGVILTLEVTALLLPFSCVSSDFVRLQLYNCCL